MNNLPVMLKALADETRFNIIKLLLTHNFCVGALAINLGISRAAVSQHLQILRKAGLVKGEKRGYWTHYTVETDMLNEIAEELKKIASQPARYENMCHPQTTMGKNIYEGREPQMCKCCCEHPEKRKEKPEKCTPEQIRECHGDEKNHPCCDEKK